MKEKLDDQFRYLVSGYFGVSTLDEYDLKVYILKEIEEYIRNFVTENPIDNFNYLEEAMLVKEKRPLKTKLQDSLIVLNRINAPMELVWLIKQKVKKM